MKEFWQLCITAIMGILIVVLASGWGSAVPLSEDETQTLASASYGSGYDGGSGRGGSGCGGSGCGGGSGAGGNAAPLSEDEKTALNEAILEEYYARDVYQMALSVLGPYNPMSNIAQSEQMHINSLANLFSKYKLTQPADHYPVDETFTSRSQACQIGVEAERDRNVIFYNIWLDSGMIEHSDIINVFTTLRDASLYHHLPAFQNCARTGM